MKRPRRIPITTAVAIAMVALFVLLGKASASLSSNAGVASCHRWGVSVAAPSFSRPRRQKVATLQEKKTSRSINDRVVTNFWDIVTLPTSRRRSLLVPPSRPFWVATAHASSSSTTTTAQQQQQQTRGDFPYLDEEKEAAWQELGPIGKFIAGTIEIILSTAIEYAGGYVSGYALGTVMGLPAFLFKSTTTTSQGGGAAAHHHHDYFWNQVRQRTARLHGKSHRWAASWAGISAAFGGFRVATKVLRGGKQDEWSTVFSSMAAGAWFARKGPCVRCVGCDCGGKVSIVD